jgi:DNA (cytosine-5)-methyltransferase 1
MNAQNPKLLDLFCGAGGCTKGYQRAGFWVCGVDHKLQPRYCGEEFIQADALEYLSALIDSEEIEDFDAIHASPPCQADSNGRNYGGKKKIEPDRYPRLIGPTRALLQTLNLPWVLENVMGAVDQLSYPIMICGTALGLRVQRHRLFESNLRLFAPYPCQHQPFDVSVRRERAEFLLAYQDATTAKGQQVRRPPSCPIKIARDAMGIDWMRFEELGEAIPPAYTEFIGRQLLSVIQAKEAGHGLENT